MKSPLQRERERRNWTQQFVADQIGNLLGPRRGYLSLGIDANAVSRHERGAVTIPRDPYPALYAELYDTTVESLWPHLQQAAGHELQVDALLAWMADHAGVSVQQAYDTVVARARQRTARDPAERYARADRQRRVSRAQIAQAIIDWYSDDGSAGFYRATVGTEPITASMLVRPQWLDVAVRLGTDQEEFHFQPSIHIETLTSEVGVQAALDRLAAVEAAGTVLDNHPIFRLLDVAVTRDRLTATFALTDFASYALTMDLLEQELIDAISQRIISELPLRRRYLPTVPAALDLDARVCVGGPVALLAAARPGHRNRKPDYALLVQERSSRVLNVPGKLAVTPKAFHRPVIEAADEAQLSASLERELEEELLGRHDLEQPARIADPFHPQRRSQPMAWLHAHPDAYRVECVGFGVNMVTGNYEFACLVLIDDEAWWERFAGQIEANWETQRIRRYSSQDTAGLEALIADPLWSNEGLFAFLQGLRRLGQVGSMSRLAVPSIDVGVAWPTTGTSGTPPGTDATVAVG
jgi:hypothetical protein